MKNHEERLKQITKILLKLDDNYGDIKKAEDNKKNNRIISLETEETKHSGFLFDIFKESHPELNLINVGTEEQKTNIIWNQFKMAKRQVIEMYPNAEKNIITLDEKLIGRLYINRDDTEYRIIEIGLLECYRNLGIGSKIVTKVIENAIKEEKNVSLQVAWFNQRAFKFYERMGFKVVANREVFMEMEYVNK